MYNGGFGVILREADQRMLHFRVFACLIFSVEGVDILDELSVQQMERNVFRTYSGAFAAVGASARYMERTDDVEHILFKAVVSGFLSDTGVRVIEYALFAGACGTYVAARIAADASGQLASPEFEAFVSGHVFELFNQVESAAVSDFFAVFADDSSYTVSFFDLQVMHLSAIASAFAMVSSP